MSRPLFAVVKLSLSSTLLATALPRYAPSLIARRQLVPVSRKSRGILEEAKICRPQRGFSREPTERGRHSTLASFGIEAAVDMDTVDKFQGQEAPIAIYSMATSTHADAPRGMDFLYSLNRFNVATSRAKCLSILVGSPRLFETECRTPRQMRLANAFCRYLELARPVGAAHWVGPLHPLSG